MSQIVNNVSNEPIGQMYGLFGLNGDQNERQMSVKEEIDGNEELNQNCDQIIIAKKEIVDNLKNCCICKCIETKYCCPNCQLRTCSLKCCQSHKQQFNCNGIRDKLAFIPIKDYSQKEFISDYCFLEETNRTIDSSARERRAIISSRPVLPKWLQKLVRETRFRGIRLKIMPAGFQKRKNNTTCYMYNEKTINWDIDCKFPHALDQNGLKNLEEVLNDDLVVSHSEYSLIKRRISENVKLSELISQFMSTNDINDNYEQNRRLIFYRNCGIEGIGVLFKLEFQNLKRKKYIELDLSKTIKDNLFGKTVVEFPTFVFILNKFKHSFDIISSERSELDVKHQNSNLKT